jgi:opacity protein-like surface antigen
MVSLRVLRILTGIVITAVFMGPHVSFAAGDLTVNTERGLFSVGLGYEYSQSRLLNTDSTFAGYTGGGLRAEIEIGFSKPGPGEFRIFGASSKLTLEGEPQTSDEIEIQSNMLGVKVFSTSWLFLGAGYGNMKQKITAENSVASTSNPVLATGLGLEFNVASSWFVSLSGWYNQSFIKKTNQFESTSYSEGMNLFLGISWSPPSVTIQQVMK